MTSWRETLRGIGFREHGTGMRVRMEDVVFDAVDHPLKGLSIWVSHSDSRTITNYEESVPIDSDAATIARYMTRAFERIHPERVTKPNVGPGQALRLMCVPADTPPPTDTVDRMSRRFVLDQGTDAMRWAVGLAASTLGLGPTDLAVDMSGYRSDRTGPIPFIRIHARSHPYGFCVACLFAFESGRIHVSLNQTPSRWGRSRDGQFTDRAPLRLRAAEARDSIAHMLPGRVWQSDLDLRDGPADSAGADHILDLDNGNVLSLSYDDSEIPSDDQLQADLTEMLRLLMSLNGEHVSQQPPSTVQDPDVPDASVPKPRRARHDDLAADPAVQAYAEDFAVAYFQDRRWDVERIGWYGGGFDLACRHPAGDYVHVKVFATRGKGAEVVLTPDEAGHIAPGRCDAPHALFMVSGIDVFQTKSTYSCTGGHERYLRPWPAAGEAPQPTQFTYRLPGSGGSLLG